MPLLDAKTSSKIACFGLVCAFFVVMIHVPQPVPSDPATPAWWLVRLSAGTLGRLGVPFYFVVSGFFLARHFGEPSWWRREMAKRVKSLLVPFFLWLLLWNAAEGALAALSNLRSGAAATAGFPSSAALLARLGIYPFDYPSNIPLWFVRSLFLYVAASGVLLPMLKKVGLALPAALLALSAALRLVGDDSCACRFLTRFVSVHGLFYFMAGASLSLGILRMPARNALFAFLGVAGAAGLFASQFLAARDVAWWGALHELSLPFALLAAWRAFPDVSWPRSLTSLTFPVYILHVFAIRALDIAMYGNISCPGLVFKFFAASAAALGLAAASRTVLPRFHSFAFGGR
ncbi:MAG: acyltransferase [Kiritimatiellae bacterium]|nr:acyltransferase [Kiritimatiellia bacterium]